MYCLTVKVSHGIYLFETFWMSGGNFFFLFYICLTPCTLHTPKETIIFNIVKESLLWHFNIGLFSTCCYATDAIKTHVNPILHTYIIFNFGLRDSAPEADNGNISWHPGTTGPLLSPERKQPKLLIALDISSRNRFLWNSFANSVCHSE